MAEIYFHFPNNTIFHGVENKPTGYSYRQARNLINEDKKIQHLKLRLEGYFINGLNETKHPFTSALLTCVGMEVLGQIMFGMKQSGETDRASTISTYHALDDKLSNTISQKFKHHYNERRKFHDNYVDCTSQLNSYAHIVIKGLRNTYMHNYRSLGIRLADKTDTAFDIKESLGIIVVDAQQFRNKFIDLFHKVFITMEENDSGNQENLQYRINALRYFGLIVK